MEEIRSLEFMPMRYKLYEEEPWNSMGLRVLPVDNYLVFYLLNEANGVVNIVHIMYEVEIFLNSFMTFGLNFRTSSI